MLFKIAFCGNDDKPIDRYFVEAANIHQASQKAQKAAEEEYAEEKPITITNIEVIDYSNVIR